MAKYTNVGFVFHTYNMRYDGLNKYFLPDGSDTIHSDRYCPYIENCTVKMLESHQVPTNTSTCGHCTVENPEFRKPRDELMQG